MAELAADERKGFIQLWADVEALLKRAEGKTEIARLAKWHYEIWLTTVGAPTGRWRAAEFWDRNHKEENPSVSRFL